MTQCENKQAKTHVVVRENIGLLREVIGRLKSMGQYVTHKTNGRKTISFASSNFNLIKHKVEIHLMKIVFYEDENKITN